MAPIFYCLIIVWPGILELISPQGAWAVNPRSNLSPNPLVTCLAREESEYHRLKIRPPEYYLNQKLLEKMIQISGLYPRKKAVQQVCSNPSSAPSLNMLQMLLSHPQGLFDLKKAGAQSNRPASKKILLRHRILLEEFLKEIPSLFERYIFLIAKKMPTHDCLDRNIPQLRSFFYKVKILENEPYGHKSYWRPQTVLQIFQRLSNWRKFNCPTSPPPAAPKNPQ